MLNETNSELQERSDKAAADEMMDRTDVQIPAPIYHDDFVDAYEIMYNAYMDRLIGEQQQIEAEEWNRHSYEY